VTQVTKFRSGRRAFIRSIWSWPHRPGGAGRLAWGLRRWSP